MAKKQIHKSESGIEYVVGRIYLSETAGDVIYRGYSEDFQRHKFELRHFAGSIRFEGEGESTGEYTFIGNISELEE